MEANLKQEIIDLIKSMQQQDSIEIGNSKTGVVKIYCDFSKPIEAQIKIQEAITILKTKREQILGE